MSLKFAVDSLDGLDESVAGLYTQHDGKYYLDVDGAVSTDKLTEFRNNNIQLKQDLEKFKDIDPQKYQEAMTKLQEIEGKKNIPAEEVDRQVAERVQTMKAEMQKQIDDLTKDNTGLNGQLETLLIDSAVRGASTKHKVLNEAIDDVVLRAKTVFRMDEGMAKPFDKDGNVIYDKDGQTPMTIEGWVKGLEKTASHLFVGSNGGGAPPGPGLRPGMKPSDMSSMQKIQAGLQK
jgi:ribosomal protein L14